MTLRIQNIVLVTVISYSSEFFVFAKPRGQEDFTFSLLPRIAGFLNK